jgi:hypothetical protein
MPLEEENCLCQKMDEGIAKYGMTFTRPMTLAQRLEAAHRAGEALYRELPASCFPTSGSRSRSSRAMPANTSEDRANKRGAIGPAPPAGLVFPGRHGGIREELAAAIEGNVRQEPGEEQSDRLALACRGPCNAVLGTAGPRFAHRLFATGPYAARVRLGFFLLPVRTPAHAQPRFPTCMPRYSSVARPNHASRSASGRRCRIAVT